MEVGIDSFAAERMSHSAQLSATPAEAMGKLLQRMVHADESGVDVFGIGEHHRSDMLDSAPATILSAAAALTKRIRLTSAVTVLSAADPVRVFQSFASVDLISNGRAEMVVGRGSSTEAFPLFGYSLNDYDALFAEKLDLLLKIRESEKVTWQGKFRPALHDQAIYPRPVQNPLPIWLGVGGTPGSFVRAGRLGLPLMVAIIGGETHRFGPLIELYRRAGAEAGHSPETLKVGLHSMGYLAPTTEEAAEDFYPGFVESMNRLGKERGWPPMTKTRFAMEFGEMGSMLLGSPAHVAEKIKRHSEALGGISRVSFQMDAAGLSHEKLMQSIGLIGEKLRPLLTGV